jgi:hypothetical protein
VQAFRGGGGRADDPGGEVAGPQRSAVAAQLAQHVELGAGQPGPGELRVRGLLQDAGRAQDPSDDGDRRGVQIGPAARPVVADPVDHVTFGHHRTPFVHK